LFAIAAAAALVAAPSVGAGTTLYDQYDNAGPIATGSQNFEASFNTYDDEAADDFVVTDSSGWLVSQVEVDGQYFNGPGPATSVNIRFYTDAGGLPGTMIHEQLNLAFTDGPAAGDLVVAINPGIPLGPGTYWLSVQVNQTFTTTGQWGWTDRTVSANMGAAWRNPGGGYGVCPNWGRRPTTCAIDPAAPDQVFRLIGNVGAGGPSLVHDLATVYDQDGDGDLEPGETFQLDERIRNIGGSSATNVTSVVSSSSSGVTITQPNSAYPDIPAGGTSTNTTRFAGAVSSSVPCGTTLNFSLAVTAAQGNFTVPFTVPMVPCPNYQITTQSGQTIVPGTIDTGNHCDDCTTPITFPFPVYVYGHPYTAAVVDSNGTLQFTGDTSPYSNTCLPSQEHGRTFFGYWDDLYTINSGTGIYTTTTGTPPNRVFYIEWRAQYYPGTGTANFELVFNENDQVLKAIYGTVTNGAASSTEGVQDSPTGLFREYGCDGSGGAISPGLAVIYTPELHDEHPDRTGDRPRHARHREPLRRLRDEHPAPLPGAGLRIDSQLGQRVVERVASVHDRLRGVPERLHATAARRIWARVSALQRRPAH
jgi:hypothetical protein